VIWAIVEVGVKTAEVAEAAPVECAHGLWRIVVMVVLLFATAALIVWSLVENHKCRKILAKAQASRARADEVLASATQTQRETKELLERIDQSKADALTYLNECRALFQRDPPTA
jgi:hypothetical protein